MAKMLLMLFLTLGLSLLTIAAVAATSSTVTTRRENKSDESENGMINRLANILDLPSYL